jgi:FixJ family two-component response regulator
MLCSAKPSVYIADDDMDVLGSLRFLLETDGFEVHAFRSGTALLSLLHAVDQPPVSCFVIDNRMPDINGVENAIKEHSAEQGPP